MSKITTELLQKIFPGTPKSKLSRFVSPMNKILPKYDITTKPRFAAFIANVGIESDRLKALEEYASGAAYEGREGLGNVRKGDGVRYKGRSVLQTTGRYNYWVVVVAYLRVITGKDWDNKSAHTNFDAYLKTKEYTDLLKEADKYNVNFLENPELLEEFPHAVEAAGVFVQDKSLNRYADNEQFYAYAGVLNRGSAKKKALHYELREGLYKLAMRVIPNDFYLDGKSTEKVTLDEPTTDVVIEGNAEVNVAGVVNGHNENGNVKVEVADGNVSVETNTPSPQSKDKVAVVAPKPVKWYSGLGTKVITAVTGNAGFIYVSDKLQELVGVVSNPVFWYVIIGVVAVGSIIWLWNEAKENRRKKDREAELIKLSLEQNSTPTNYVQTIPYDEVELYRLRGYKIIPIGESVPTAPPPT